jgi:hypothetical protein
MPRFGGAFLFEGNQMNTLVLFLDILAVASILLIGAALSVGLYINNKLGYDLYELNAAAYVVACISVAWLISTSLT